MKIKKVMAPKTARVISLFAVCLVCLLLIWTGAVTAQQRNPLLIPGKRTLYQKVITHPGAKLFAIDGDSVQVLENWIKPFTVYYVYERASVAGEPWLEVGLSSTEGPDRLDQWGESIRLEPGLDTRLYRKNRPPAGAFFQGSEFSSNSSRLAHSPKTNISARISI